VSRAALFAIVLSGLQWPQPEQQRLPPPAPIVSHNITVLREWVQSVYRHVPGETDAALLSIAAWTRADVQAAWVDVQALLAVVKDKNANIFYLQPAGERNALRTHMTRQDLLALQNLAKGVREGVGSLPLFVKRAALLHSDIAQQFQIDSESLPNEAMWSPRRFVVQTDDGQQTGVNGGIVHWEFGRVLLDAVPEAGRDEFVRSWYRATLAFKLAVEELDTPHFNHALAIFPNDAVIRYLHASLHDAFSHSGVQSVIESAKLPPKIRLEVQSEANELREAAAEYRRAIELDPALGEARLRHGRVLARQGKHKEAAAELRPALSMVRVPMLEYYARMFLGAAEEALGRTSEARALYQEAAKLYPRAQAPRVALSQLAHKSGNRAAARETLDVMFDRGSQISEEDDPWWFYQRAAGRMADQWREATYRLLPR
jgi:tetratricopeptide (TPR) repeat protein